MYECFSFLKECVGIVLLPQGRSFTWLGEQEMYYSNWKDGEPNQMAGCGHMTTSGLWSMTPCDAKLDAAICEIGGMCTNLKLDVHR